MDKFQENQIQNLEEVIGGKIKVKVKVTGVLDGVKGNTDVEIGAEF